MSNPSQDSAGHSPSERRALALALPRHAVPVDAAAYAAGADSQEESLNLRDLLRIFLKRKWTITAIFVISAVFSVVLTYLAPPVYRASTTIQIERFMPQVLDYKDASQLEAYQYDTTDFYQTNYELLKSRSLAERAVEDIGLRKPGVEEPETPAPRQESDGSLLHNLLSRLRSGPTAVEISPAQAHDNAVVGAFQGSVTVEPVRNSRLVRLHFDSTDPFFAAKAVNSLAQAFININLERRFEASAYAKTFLEEKLQQTKAKLEDSERELVRYSRELEIVNVGDKSGISDQNVQEFSSALTRAEQERIKAEVAYKQAQENPESLPVVRHNETILILKQAKAKLEGEYQENLRIYKPAFPKMLQIRGQIDEVDKQIEGELGKIRAAARSHFAAAREQEMLLRARLEAAKSELHDVKGRTIRYGILKREVDTNRTLYDGLLQRLKEVGVAGGVGANNISVVDKALVPTYAYKPNLRKNVTMGMLIGLLVGLMVAWLLEHFDDSIRFVDDVEREIGSAVLGVVPKLKAGEAARSGALALGSHSEPTSAFSEAYRSVRTALQFSTSSGAPRRLAVTSSSKAEGKSTSALALAINFAQMGKPVLIIDADLRNPALHKLLKVDNSRGLSNYLSGSEDPLQLAQPTVVPNLFVLTTGPLPPNPVELLSSMKLLDLLSQCEARFAHVVVDAPPVLGIADAIVLCNQVENSVFVVESGKTRKGHAKAALKRLHQAGVHPLGVILTKIDAYHDLYGYDSYYYQYAANEPAATKKEVATA